MSLCEFHPDTEITVKLFYNGEPGYWDLLYRCPIIIDQLVNGITSPRISDNYTGMTICGVDVEYINVTLRQYIKAEEQLKGFN